MTDLDIIRPRDERELASIITDAAQYETPLEICGTGTKREVGRPAQTAAVLSTEALSGITLYQPSELVLSARAGTPLHEIEAALARYNQQLAFEPVDLGPLLGREPGLGTIGAVFAANLSGPRRVQVGAARDHFIGMRAVNGRGEVFKAGGRVMKNVTGYDLCRGLAGSWGTLAVMSEVTMKVLPMAEETRTLVLRGLTDDVAVEAMCSAMGTPFEVSGAAHVQASLVPLLGDAELAERRESLTLLRLENFSSSLDYRCKRLASTLRLYGRIRELDNRRSLALWDDLRRLRFFAGSEGAVWRLSIAPKLGPDLVAAIAQHVDCRAFYDWSGGLIWLELPPLTDAGATEVRGAIAQVGGHATLVRADAAVRSSVDVFHPLEPGVAELTKRLKQAFDPAGILNPGRMYPGL